MKLKGEIIATRREAWPSESISIDCRRFSFVVPKHLANNYPVGREIEIEVTPK